MARGKQAFPLAFWLYRIWKIGDALENMMVTIVGHTCAKVSGIVGPRDGRGGSTSPTPSPKKKYWNDVLPFLSFIFYFSFSISFFSFFLSFFLPLLLYFLSSVVVFSVIVLFCLYVWNYWGNLPPSHLICTSYSAWLSRRKYRVRCLLAFSILYTRSQDVYSFLFLSTRCIKRGT